MKENRKKILDVLTTKHIETIKTAKLSNINGGDSGCTVIVDPNLEALTTKHIETIKIVKLSNINGGDSGCIVVIHP